MPWRRLFSDIFNALRTRGLVWGFALVDAVLAPLFSHFVPKTIALPSPSTPVTWTSLGTPNGLLALASILVSTLLSVLLEAAAIYAILQPDANERAILRAVWERRMALVGIALALTLALVVPLALMMGPAVFMLLLGRRTVDPTLGSLYAIWIMATGLLTLIVLFWFPWPIQACIQEQRSTGSAVRRSWDVFVERLGTVVLVEILSWISMPVVSYVLATPFYLLKGTLPPPPVFFNLWYNLGMGPVAKVGSTLSSTMVTAFTWTLHTLAWPYLSRTSQPSTALESASN